MAAPGVSVFPVTPSCSSSEQSCGESVERFVRLKPEFMSNSFVGTKLSILPSRLNLVTSKRLGSTVATVSFSPPTGKTAGAVSDKKPKFSANMAELEARKLKYPNTGTEAPLMVEGTGSAANFFRENGITLLKVREETREC